MWDDTCRWARPRLPLIAGGELTGSDRRKVERHLIGCPECRVRLEAFNASLGAIQLSASEPLSLSNAASLWPALARQIREQRRPEPALWLRPTSWIAVGLAASAFVAVGAAASWSVSQYQRGQAVRTAALPVPKSLNPVANSAQAVSEVNSAATVADNSNHRPDGEPAATPATNASRTGNASSSGIRTPEPTH